MLVNPTIFLGTAIVIGHLLTSKVQLQAPLLTSIFLKKESSKTFLNQLSSGIALGAVAGCAILAISKASQAYLPPDFLDMAQNFPQSLCTKFLYGGIAEEIMVRWGIMTLVVWLSWLATGSKTPIKPVHYLLGITLSSSLFGILHLPIVLLVVKQPTAFLITYIVGLNMIFGWAAGWLFWKKGIEAAIFAHITAHVVFALSA